MSRLPYVPIVQRFPKHYQKFLEDMKRPRARIQCRPPAEKFRYDEHQRKVFPNVDARIPTMYLPETKLGLWGGEEAVVGFKKREEAFGSFVKFWWPQIHKQIFYSEILDKHFQIQVTEYAMSLIDKACGLDMYLLTTPVQDLNSQLGLDLRRKLLLALVRKEIYPEDEEKRAKILEKYKEFIVPEEEAEWFGLNLREATWKQLELEQTAKSTPLKAQFRAKLIERLQSQRQEATA